jgi:hypothetical protein
VLLPDPLSLTSSVYPATKNPENTEAEPNDVEAADEGDIQMEYCCD